MKYIVNVIHHHQVVVDARDEEEAKEIALEDIQGTPPGKTTITVGKNAPKRWFVVIGYWPGEYDEHNYLVQAECMNEAEEAFRDYLVGIYGDPEQREDIGIARTLESDTEING